MGATPVDDGVNFAVFSAHATAVTVCLFEGETEVSQLPLWERTGDIWHGMVKGLGPGQRYGLRVEGPYAPREGHRFNPNKLLIDPYARALSGPLVWDDALMGHQVGHPDGDLSFDRRDSAAFVPKSVVCAPQPAATEPRPMTPWVDTVIYEAHVKGLTKLHPGVAAQGTYAGLADPALRDHLKALGVTAIELLPVQGFIEDTHLVRLGLPNYWGYQTLTFFAAEPRYGQGDPIAELRAAISALHADRIEVILDVVYNHTAEGGAGGPTLMFRGLDNASYYRLGAGGAYVNDTGTGNALDMDHWAVQRLVMDSLRFWVERMGVDGFRFDLGTSLGRSAPGGGFSPHAGLLRMIRQDPILAPCKLIAEPWDIGPGGYQLGAFPAPFGEWNDRFRDTVRRFWRGDAGMVPRLAAVVAGSAAQFDHSGRRATSSVNFLTAHDGFTLVDVVSYAARHNEANGEGNGDGHSENHSDNMGIEGATEDPEVDAARDRRRRNMLATLMLSQGTPMLLAGDELGNSQGGNNNAYCQDNPVSWLDWDGAEPAFLAFVQGLITLRRETPVLRQRRFLHSLCREVDGQVDLVWHHPDGHPMGAADWRDESLQTLCVEKRMAAETPLFADSDQAVFAVFNRGPARAVTLPGAQPGRAWRLAFTTALDPGASSGDRTLEVAAQSVLMLRLEHTQ